MFIFVNSVVILQVLLFSVYAWESGPLVETTNGTILGQESVTEEGTKFYVFRGIPYAKPPLGNLRFQAPQPLSENWTGIYNATYPRSVCTTYDATDLYTVLGSENCLFINVYTPHLATNSTEDKAKLATIVWIYGGGFIFGSGDLGLHGTDRFLDNNTIIVSFNYRLGIFGFISTEDSVIPGNYGLKDQVLALQWVQANIAFFGGDPNNVTIMGESAGAASVHCLIQSKRANGLFQKAIAESGSTLNPWSQARRARLLAFKIGLLNGIITTSSQVLVNRLRSIGYKTLQRSATIPQIMDLYDPLNGLPFAPIIEVESAEAVFTGNSTQDLSLGKFSRVPLLHGFNSLEGRDASTLPWYGDIILGQFNLDSSNLTPLDMHANATGKSSVGRRIKSYYFNNSLITPDTCLAEFVSDDEFVRGIIKTAQLQSKYAHVYLYRFAFTGGVTHKDFDPEGAAHSEELQFLWLSNTTVQNTTAGNLTSIRMVEMWTNFAKTGNPTPRLDMFINVTWPLVNATGDTDVHYLNIDTVLEARINPEPNQMKFWKDQYQEYGNPPYNTY